MPELSPGSSRLARRVVQDRGAFAISRTGGAGLPLMWATCRVSRRKDRTWAAERKPGEEACGPGNRVGCSGSDVRRRDITGVCHYARTWKPVCELLDSTRGPTGGLERESQETGAVKMTILTPEEKQF